MIFSDLQLPEFQIFFTGEKCTVRCQSLSVLDLIKIVFLLFQLKNLTSHSHGEVVLKAPVWVSVDE